MEWNSALILMVALITVLVISGLPIAIALLLPSIILFAMMGGPERAMFMMSQEIAHFWSNWALMAIPLFVVMGEVLVFGGSASDIFDMASKWMRRMPGGLALSTVVASAIFASMCGSTAAATSVMAVVSGPEMFKRKYNKRLATGAICAAGGLAQLIPPSILMVVYASVVEISPGRALMAGAIPGVLLAVYYCIAIVIWTKVRPGTAPPEPSSTWKEKFASLNVAWQPIVLVMAVMGALYLGIATATEAAAMGAFAALIITLAKTHGNLGNVGHAFIGAARISCFIMFIAVSGKILSATMTYYMIPQHMVDFIMQLNLNRAMVIVMIQVLYLFLGMFIDPIGMMVCTLPIVGPVLISLGFDPYWFGVLLLVNFEMAGITPPLCPVVYIVKGVVPQVSLKDIIYGAGVFCVVDLLMLVTLYAFPQLALWLPSMMSG